MNILRLQNNELASAISFTLEKVREVGTCTPHHGTLQAHLKALTDEQARRAQERIPPADGEQHGR